MLIFFYVVRKTWWLVTTYIRSFVTQARICLNLNFDPYNLTIDSWKLSNKVLIFKYTQKYPTLKYSTKSLNRVLLNVVHDIEYVFLFDKYFFVLPTTTLYHLKHYLSLWSCLTTLLVSKDILGRKVWFPGWKVCPTVDTVKHHGGLKVSSCTNR